MTTATVPETAPVPALRRLYLVRFGFALLWAIALFVLAPDLGPVVATLLVLYPLFDVGAAVVDARASRGTRSVPALVANIVLSTSVAIGLAFAVTSGAPAVLRVWGIWAIVAGLVQLLVALRRRALGGQWAMIASGGLSVLAGASFVLQSTGPDAMVGSTAGYALLGGVFFLVSALRLGRAARSAG
ncbi:hypothetical protein [Pseudonocardia sp. HH130630-07]|uniref:hypothetical protein n=1 Tax=Pseudonocardia sp. HH130630-07 TaxID=1690815 RepID=UPI0008151FF3|nr:hypothetical protein [Pseudonocardia sp. HH130630-07]ANY07584.1 hypothetical protein AFB00_16225 [Pseudonocardia sp. HH130630-07]